MSAASSENSDDASAIGSVECGNEKHTPDPSPGLEGENDPSMGACGGNTDSPSGDSPDDSYDRTQNYPRRNRKMRKAKLTIDLFAWNHCIEREDTNQIGDLLRKKKIPNNILLNEAKKIFDIKYVRRICNAICLYIVQKSIDVLYVYPTICETPDRGEAPITFVVVCRKHAKINNEFKLHVKHQYDLAYRENKTMKQREKETGIFEDENNTVLPKLEKYLREHSKELMKKHTNVCRISYSGFKSVRYGKEDESMKQVYCITFYVYAKGLIPLGENKLPSMLSIDGYEAPVDVREGFVELYGGNDGPNDSLHNLRMGCSIGGVTHPIQKNIHGTLGGFFEFGGADLCFSSAHVFLTAKEMQRHKTKERQSLEAGDSIKNAYQPHDVYHESFGKGRMAVYSEGGNGKTGVDVLSIHIENRNPNSGEFPKSDEDTSSDKTYSTGKVYNRDEIRSLLKKKNRCVMKYGCSTGWTTGTFRLDGAVFRASHPVQDGNTQFNICLHNQFEIQSDTENDFAANSDSGALVFMEDNDELVAIGMVEAGMANDVCFVTPLDEILEALGLDTKSGLKQFNFGVNASVPDDTTSINEEITTLRSGLDQVTSDVTNTKEELIVVKGAIDGMKGDISEIKGGMERGFDAILKKLP